MQPDTVFDGLILTEENSYSRFGSEPGRDLLRNYYEAQPKESKSQGLAEFTYNDLCMVMDYYYEKG